MLLSIPSIFACSLALTILILLLYVVMKHNSILAFLGPVSPYFFGLLIILRGLLPFDFYKIRLTKSYYSTHVLTYIYDTVHIPLVKTKSSSITLLTIIIFLWFLGAIAFLVKRALGYWNYRKRLNQLSDNVPIQIRNVSAKANCLIFPGKIHDYDIRLLESLSSPAVFGSIKPVILLPNIKYTDQEIYYIFLHEFLHIRHKDFLVKVLSDMIIAMQWWNPVIYHIFPQLLRQAQELYVDNSIKNTLTSEEMNYYLESIHKTVLSSLNYKKRNPNYLYTFCDVNSQSRLIQRLTIITCFSKKKISAFAILSYILLILLSFTFVFEQTHIVKYDENHNCVYRAKQDSSFVVKSGDNYDIYLENTYMCTYSYIPSHFTNLPVYNSITEKE